MTGIITLCTLVSTLMFGGGTEIEDKPVQVEETCSDSQPPNDLEPYRLRDPTVVFESQEKYDECEGETMIPVGMGGWQFEVCSDDDKASDFCGGSFYLLQQTTKDIYLFCTDEEYLATHWEEVQEDYRWLPPQVELFTDLEKQYELPLGTLAAVAAPRGFEFPKEDLINDYTGTVGFFGLDRKTAKRIGLNVVKKRIFEILFSTSAKNKITSENDERLSLNVTAERLADLISQQYQKTQDIDVAIRQVLGKAPDPGRIEYINKVLSGPSSNASYQVR
jgi:acetolactate synthase regulatory subunit